MAVKIIVLFAFSVFKSKTTSKMACSTWSPILNNHVSSLSQIKGAEESQFLLCCNVWFEQQRSSPALQNLGGKKHLNAKFMLRLNVVSPFLKQQIWSWLMQQFARYCLLQRIPSKTKRIYCAYERLMVSYTVFSFQYISEMYRQLPRCCFLLLTCFLIFKGTLQYPPFILT